MKRAGFTEYRKGQRRGNRDAELGEGKVAKQMILVRREKSGAHEGPDHQPEQVCAEHPRERINTRGADVGQEAEPDYLIGDGNKARAGEKPNQQSCRVTL